MNKRDLQGTQALLICSKFEKKRRLKDSVAPAGVAVESGFRKLSIVQRGLNNLSEGRTCIFELNSSQALDWEVSILILTL